MHPGAHAALFEPVPTLSEVADRCPLWPRRCHNLQRTPAMNYTHYVNYNVVSLYYKDILTAALKYKEGSLMEVAS